MKKLVFLFLLSASLFSCEKFDIFDREKSEPCPTVSPESVPQVVKDAFAVKYPSTSVTTWYNRDNNGYAAAFTYNGTETLADFDNNGNFQNEEVDGDNNDGDHQDNDHQDTDEEGCDCGSEDGD